MAGKDKPRRVSRLGLDDRSFGERAARLVNKAAQSNTPPPKRAGAPRRSSFGEPAEFSDAQKERLRKLRSQSRKKAK